MTKLFVIIFIFLSIKALPQEILIDKIYSNTIRTAICQDESNDLVFPAYELKSNRNLIFTFDDLDADVKSYSYSIIHCNADWTQSNLFKNEYIDGYSDERVNDYQTSFNTTINYTHYSIVIPNEFLKPKLSGNYILQIFDNNNPEKPVVSKRFLVIEPMVAIDAIVKNVNQSAYFYNDQELEIKLDFTGSDIYNPTQNTNLVVLKNFNWKEEVVITKPDIIRGQEVEYNNYQLLKFKGGNEFHYFNSKRIDNNVGNVLNIDFIDNMYHFQLNADLDRTFKEYIYEPDLNGLFKIDAANVTDPSTEADYVYVYFTLRLDAPMNGSDIYVWGALTNYDFSPENKMVYNFEQKAYECRLLLKQGYHNYQYVLVENNNPDFTYIEGNHAQTENIYTLLIYYHDYRGNYDRLIGLSEVSSVTK